MFGPFLFCVLCPSCKYYRYEKGYSPPHHCDQPIRATSCAAYSNFGRGAGTKSSCAFFEKPGAGGRTEAVSSGYSSGGGIDCGWFFATIKWLFFWPFLLIPKSRYNKPAAFVVCLLFGFLGVHRFAARRIGTGILWFFTAGLLGIGWAYDLVTLATGGYLGAKPTTKTVIITVLVLAALVIGFSWLLSPVPQFHFY
ncbi:MAG: TM2 domain-containing protein [Treponema sp.]|nr:TM2 domain-containing protein [Treponema sp.]